jgi:hypothetical protein
MIIYLLKLFHKVSQRSAFIDFRMCIRILVRNACVAFITTCMKTDKQIIIILLIFNMYYLEYE